LHDIAALDRRGIPGCAVISEAFKPAAAAQSKSLGFEPAIVWVAHPIQNRTPDQLADLADAAIDAILSVIAVIPLPSGMGKDRRSSVERGLVAPRSDEG
jgi:hypothetical protein